MTKTPEELTEDWKAGKLHKRFDEPKLFYCKTDNGIEILKTWGYKNLEFLSMADEVFEPVDDVQILAPVPTYDEYKAMQKELAEHRRYCCCEENEVMRRKLAEMEEKNKMWDELAENLLCLEEQNWENLVKNGTKEQRLDFLKRKEKYSLLAILDKYEQLKKELESARWYQTVQNEDIGKLRGLLKECKEELEYHSELIFCELESDNSKIEFKHLLTRINAALGESEEK